MAAAKTKTKVTKPRGKKPESHEVSDESGFAAAFTKSVGKPKPKPEGTAPHLMVVARAGTGKTTTSVGGIALLCGDTPKVKTPSSQQQAIWDAMLLERPRNIRVCAFSKIIEQELQKRITWSNCEVRTCHGFGNSFLRQDSRTKFAKMVQDFKTVNLLEKILNMPFREMTKNKIPRIQVEDLVKLAKMNLVNPLTDSPDEIVEMFDELAALHGIELNGNRERAYTLAYEVLLRSCTPEVHPKYGTEQIDEIDFGDMVWLPTVLDVQIDQVDLCVVDEAQDLNRAQQELACRMGRRLVLVGDDKQAIFAFAGADCKSMSRMAERLATTSRGLQELPLNITYRCGQKIVERAQRFVPDYSAYAGNGPGTVIDDFDDRKLVAELQQGDMVVCRINAPLVSLVFKLFKEKKKARIQGRDIGKGLLTLVDRMKTDDLIELQAKLLEWHGKELAKLKQKKFPSEGAIIALGDKLNCVMHFVQNSDSVQKVKDTIEAIFTDNGTGILLSSVHRAKGLEAERVFILKPEKMPHPMAKTPEAIEQERNLQYVSITRAIKTLVYVKTVEKEQEFVQ